MTDRPRIAIPKNTVAVCPKCQVSVGRFIADVWAGDRFIAEVFESYTMVFEKGAKLVCFDCGTEWASGGRIFTSAGWIP